MLPGLDAPGHRGAVRKRSGHPALIRPRSAHPGIDRNPRAEVSAHFIIGKRGEVVQCVPETWRAWHAGESYLEGADHLNDESVGIELVNAQTGHDPFPDAQMDSLERLLSHLMVKHGVTWTHVLGHRQVTLKPDVKRDPADNFPWNRVAARVADRIAAFRSKGLANVGQH